MTHRLIIQLFHVYKHAHILQNTDTLSVGLWKCSLISLNCHVFIMCQRGGKKSLTLTNQVPVTRAWEAA